MMMREKTIGSRYAPVTEAQHQAALCDWWAWACKGYGIPEQALAHIPNEGRRSVGYGARLKREGLRPGFPDLGLFAPAHGKNGLFLELKAWGGKIRDGQEEYLEMLRGQGYAAAICYGWEAAKRAITDYLAGREIPPRIK